MHRLALLNRSTWLVAWWRIHNRWLDLRGWLSGYCMATTWRDEGKYRPGFSSGYSHWRCWRKRHPAWVPHRFNNYIWSYDTECRYTPLPQDFDGRGQGIPPRWGRHHAVASRRRSRQESIKKREWLAAKKQSR